MAWETALFLGLERRFCDEKRSSKKKATSRVRRTSSSRTVIFDRENGSLRLQKRHSWEDIP